MSGYYPPAWSDSLLPASLSLTFNGLHGVTPHKIELLIINAVRILNFTAFIKITYWRWNYSTTYLDLWHYNRKCLWRLGRVWEQTPEMIHENLRLILCTILSDPWWRNNRLQNLILHITPTPAASTIHCYWYLVEVSRRPAPITWRSWTCVAHSKSCCEVELWAPTEKRRKTSTIRLAIVFSIGNWNKKYLHM
jgi:hypothetical protein